MGAPGVYMRLDLQLSYCSENFGLQGRLGTRGGGAGVKPVHFCYFGVWAHLLGAKDSLGNKYVGNHRKARLV